MLSLLSIPRQPGVDVTIAVIVPLAVIVLVAAMAATIIVQKKSRRKCRVDSPKL